MNLINILPRLISILGLGYLAAAPEAFTRAILQGTPTDLAQQKIEAGRTAELRGDYEGAIIAYAEAERSAREVGSTEARCDAILRLTSLQVQRSRNSAKDGKLSVVEEENCRSRFREVVETGSVPQKSLAWNNLGLLSLLKGDLARAREEFQRADTESFPPGQRYLLEFNKGEVALQQGRKAEAAEQYRKAMQLQPRFAPAAERYFNLRAATEGIDSAYSFSEHLLSSGQGALAARLALEFLERSGNEAESQKLLAIPLRHYASLSFASFEPIVLPQLERLRKRQPALSRAADDIEAAYRSDQTKPEFAEWEINARFPAWPQGSEQRKALSGLFKSIGDYFALQATGNKTVVVTKALWRYATAWALDGANTDAAVATAVALRDHGPESAKDPVYDQFSRSVFDITQTLYRTNFKSKDDWRNILRLHVVLAELDGRMGRWGPDFDTNTAQFQWKKATEVEAVLRGADPIREVDEPSPQLHLRLAEAYLHPPSRLERACEEYLIAAQAFVKDNDRMAAIKAVERAELLRLPFTAPQRTILADLGLLERIDHAPIAVGERAPTFAGIPASIGFDRQDAFDLDRLRDKVVVLTFVDSHAGSRGGVLEEASQLYGRFAGNPGVSCVVVAEDPEGKFRAKSSPLRTIPNLIVADDSGHRIARTLGATAAPSFIVLDGERVVRYRGRLGSSKGEPPFVLGAVEALLAGRPVEIKETPFEIYASPANASPR